MNESPVGKLRKHLESQGVVLPAPSTPTPPCKRYETVWVNYYVNGELCRLVKEVHYDLEKIYETKEMWGKVLCYVSDEDSRWGYVYGIIETKACLERG
jgi:hypothetical protein